MSDRPSLKDLVRGAFVKGDLSEESARVLTNLAVLPELARGLGFDCPRGSEVMLVSVVVDDTSSIQVGGYTAPILEGHNRLLAIMREAAGSMPILLSTRCLSGKIINPYSSVANAVNLSSNNYNPYRFIDYTPLFLQSVLTLGDVMVQTELLEREGYSVRTITLIMSDGGDNHYSMTANDARWLVSDLQRSKKHLVAAYAVGASSTDVSQVFRSMGIESKWILTSPDALKSLLTFAQTVVRASLSAESFDKLLLGPGFGS